MRNLLLLLMLIVSPLSIANNQSLPGSLGVDPQGNSVALKPGKPAILTFWASWCPYCKKAMPRLEHIQASLGKQHIDIIFINTREKGSKREKRTYYKKLARYFQDGGLQSQFIFDKSETLYKAMSKPGLPTMIFVDKKGQIVDKVSGYSEKMDQALLEASKRLL